jgi:hypothetical protein
VLDASFLSLLYPAGAPRRSGSERGTATFVYFSAREAGRRASRRIRLHKQSLFHRIDINDAPRKAIHKFLINRREQMVGDGLQLTLDALYWNGQPPDEEPIVLPMYLSPDIEWRMNAPDEDGKVA